MSCHTNEALTNAEGKLIGSTSKAWVEGVFRSYQTVNGGSAAPARAEGRGSA